ncbi:MAG TPA: sugar ABC transporter substrate-binding protein, partial [Candidatus Sphingobacterium stercoripullorum]|nr:sugar ABC transporter substrate-binding protein [Candidatus Sphingobacterium stercoripullorum]
KPEFSPSLNVYWVYAIGQGSKHKERAYDFINFAVSIANDKALTLSGGVGCRRSTWHDPEINASIPFYKKLPELHQTARSLPRIRKWADVATIIDNMTTQAIKTDKTIQELIAEAEKEIKAL